jgi:ribose transport system substrate-binding protein
MIAFERQQTILRLLQEQPGLKVTKLAELLGVSRGTIRNDLVALEEDHKVKRMRGGAVLLAKTLPKSSFAVPVELSPTENEAAKRRIARWAAELIEDGEAVFLDASTTVQQMIPFLISRRNLTIITNGLQTAQLVKQQTKHMVIMLGGVLVNGGDAVGGLLHSAVLNHLNISTSFVSGTGFTLETGVTERSLEEAQLKEGILAKSRQTAVLMDETKLGKVGVVPFAKLEDISHFFTSGDFPADFIQQMRTANVTLTVCGENTVRSFTTADNQPQYRLGFANQSETLPFAIDVRRGLERAAASRNNIDLVIVDNKLSGEEALRVADKLIARDIDLVIEYQIDYKSGNLIMDKFRQINIPVIAVDIPMVGATFFGVDNYRAGYVAGEAMGQWLQREWQGDFDQIIVLEEPRAGVLPAARIQGQLDGVTAVIKELPQEKLIYLESGNTSSVSEAQVYKTLQSLPDKHRIVVLSFNSDSVIGTLNAARRLGREEDIIIVGQGADRLVVDEIRQPGSRIIGSTAYMPERYGEQLLQLASKILQGEPVPPAVYTEHIFLDANNVNAYYPLI